MTESAARSALAALCGETADACRQAVADHVAAKPAALRFQRQVLLALATLTACSRLPELGPADIRLARDTADDAAAVSRTEPPDDAVSELVRRFEEVVDACDAALGQPGGGLWERFHFADADVEVMRAHGRWHVRADGDEASDRLLDAALGRLVRLTNLRVAALTVQILDWYEQ